MCRRGEKTSPLFSWVMHETRGIDPRLPAWLTRPAPVVFFSFYICFCTKFHAVEVYETLLLLWWKINIFVEEVVFLFFKSACSTQDQEYWLYGAFTLFFTLKVWFWLKKFQLKLKINFKFFMLNDNFYFELLVKNFSFFSYKFFFLLRFYSLIRGHCTQDEEFIEFFFEWATWLFQVQEVVTSNDFTINEIRHNMFCEMFCFLIRWESSRASQKFHNTRALECDLHIFNVNWFYYEIIQTTKVSSL